MSANFGRLPGADQRLLQHQKRRVDLLVAVLPRVEIEHPGDQRPLQPRAIAAQNVEARPGDLHPALEVDDAQRLGKLPMRLRGEVECALRPVFGDHDVAALVRGDRDMLQRHVGHLQQQALELGVDRLHLVIESADAIAKLAHADDQRLPLRRRPWCGPPPSSPG